MKCGECLDCLKGYYLLRNGSAHFILVTVMNISDVEKVSVNKIWDCKVFFSLPQVLITRKHTHKQPSCELNQFPIWYWLRDILHHTDTPIL